jgi:hypothetical protein
MGWFSTILDLLTDWMWWRDSGTQSDEDRREWLGCLVLVLVLAVIGLVVYVALAKRTHNAAKLTQKTAMQTAYLNLTSQVFRLSRCASSTHRPLAELPSIR